MKKLLSIVLSVMMIFAVGAASTTMAMAADQVGSIQTTSKSINVTVEVNGNVSKDITYKKDASDPKKITFTYNGDGDLIGWEFYDEDHNLLVEGVDYEVVSEDGNTITILLTGYEDDVTANAKVKFDNGETTTKKGGKGNNSSKSPKTGAVAAAGIAVAGAGVAILAAMKKKDDAE